MIRQIADDIGVSKTAVVKQIANQNANQIANQSLRFQFVIFRKNTYLKDFWHL